MPVGKTMRLTDLVLENPQGDSGVVTIAVGGRTLLAPALENFREQDFHWASAILVAGQGEGHPHGLLRRPRHPARLRPGPDHL